MELKIIKKRAIIVASIILLLVAIGAAVTCYTKKEVKYKVNAKAECAIRTDMRKLWSDHAFWTREVIRCIVDNSPDKDQSIDRLLKNQDEIGNAIKPYYGDAAGKELTRLLREHIILAAQVVVAARDNNTQALKIAQIKWNSNADEIAEFLSKATNVDYSGMKYMMDYHLKLTTYEALSRINKNYIKNVEDFDKVYYEVLEMSDMISVAIIRQQPDKFQCEPDEEHY